MSEFSFQKGWGQVTIGQADAVKAEIMKKLGITSNSNWLQRLKGRVEPKVSEAKAIETVFKRYGIRDIWGEK
ncbi:hypothetical protein SDC9_20248 [bioreactor metagenome]|uniref:Uncharacterized protein n=1 Tax=bioreactor metagenome TaxID=1076179 RepID=A0A644U679_9ZZZZ